jgi:hypothetical protein
MVFRFAFPFALLFGIVFIYIYIFYSLSSKIIVDGNILIYYYLMFTTALSLCI